MTPYEAPKFSSGIVSGKFVRVGDRLFTGDGMMDHTWIATVDGVLEELNKLKESDPCEVDGGRYKAKNDTIKVSGSSATLRLPLSAEARARTIVIFQEQSPDYEVSVGTDF